MFTSLILLYLAGAQVNEYGSVLSVSESSPRNTLGHTYWILCCVGKTSENVSR